MSNSGNPRVTCFCPTRNRRAWLPYAIECFKLQTYANRELLIVADGDDVRDLVPFDDERITLLSILAANRPRFLSEKFNLCCAIAKTDVLCKWDDDDWYAPSRIADQVALLESSGKALAGYYTGLFTDGVAWWRYTGTPNWALGTSLCFRRDWWQSNPFPSAVQAGSDNAFAWAASAAGQLVSVEGGETIVASIHRNHTSPRLVSDGNNWEKLVNFPGVSHYRRPPLDGVAA